LDKLDLALKEHFLAELNYFGVDDRTLSIGMVPLSPSKDPTYFPFGAHPNSPSPFGFGAVPVGTSTMGSQPFGAHAVGTSTMGFGADTSVQFATVFGASAGGTSTFGGNTFGGNVESFPESSTLLKGKSSQSGLKGGALAR
jgi:hypothetical protein